MAKSDRPVGRAEKNELLITVVGAFCYAGILGVSIFVIAGFMPLLPPELTGADLVQRFARDHTRILAGMTLLAFCSGFLWLISAALTQTMKRMESKDSHPWATIQMAASTGSVMVVLLSAYLWIGIAYRGVDVDPGVATYINDIAWLMFIGAYPPAFIQNLAVIMAVLRSRAPIVLIPKWVGSWTIIVQIINFGGALLCFETESSLFTWNGIIGFWVVAGCYFSWFGLMWWQNRRAIRRWYDYQYEQEKVAQPAAMMNLK
jgi:hypothetical protein